MVVTQYDVFLIDLDQIRTVDRVRLVKKLGRIQPEVISKVKAAIQEMLVD